MQISLHPVAATNTYVTVVLPMALPKPYTYYVSEELIEQIQFGVRVEVQFGKSKLYAALVIDIHEEKPAEYNPKPVISIIDETPIINRLQLKLWKWMADYYCCTLGEMMSAALPANLKLTSETRLQLSPFFDENYEGLSDKEYLITEALTIQEEISIDDVRKILNQRTVYPLIKKMLDKKILFLKEDLKNKYKPKLVSCVRLREPYFSQPELLKDAFALLTRSTRQVEALMAFIQINKEEKPHITRQELYKMAKVDSSVLKALEKKGIFELYKKQVNRMGGYEEELLEARNLSPQQERAIGEIRTAFEKHTVVLLQGVTGSGKTRVYVELIQKVIDEGGQVLYLLPEIALTAQIVVRLQKIFGDDIAIYHSKLNNNERVEMWNMVLNGKKIILGARSGIFLPYNDLRLIIVDEEHDPSFKQTDPNPRYNGRDIAVLMGHFCDAKVLLGTATPSVESYHNAKMGKYGLVEMPERFGGIEMPEIVIVDAKEELKKRTLQSHFTSVLLEQLKSALERGEQAILFQNRRGYAPTYQCKTCGWHSECIHCDVSLTYHKFHNNLKCHYCGYQTAIPKACPACGTTQLTIKGFGTEKIEDELKIYLPDAKIGRMDLDTVRSKNAHGKIINDFEEKRINILVGTQMVTKGLDFENVGIVGVLSADQLIHFPDFRATERAFQLMTQVSGRAGRKHKRGKVIIQAFNTAHPVLTEVFDNDFLSFFSREITERRSFKYPPFYRLIKITLRHKKPEKLNQATKIFDKNIKSKLGDWVKGPAIPYVSRVRGYFLIDFLVKIEKNPKKIKAAKEYIQEAADEVKRTEGLSGVRVKVNVDPY